MTLPRASRRAYREAFHQRTHGAPSKAWKKRPGSRCDLEVWMFAFDAAEEDNISPWDALLLTVRRRSARVRMVDRTIQAAWEQHRALCAQHDGDPAWNPDVPGDEVRKWMVESRNEERLLSRASKMAIDAGVAKMLIERDQLEGRLLADALVAGLDSLDLTTEQRMKALGEAQRALTSIVETSPDVNPGPRTIPGIVMDEEDPDKDAD